jgi:hypothetical protein
MRINSTEVDWKNGRMEPLMKAIMIKVKKMEKESLYGLMAQCIKI